MLGEQEAASDRTGRPSNEPRMQHTVECVRRELDHGGLLLRYERLDASTNRRRSRPAPSGWQCLAHEGASTRLQLLPALRACGACCNGSGPARASAMTTNGDVFLRAKASRGWSKACAASLARGAASAGEALAHSGDHAPVVRLAKDGAARHEGVRTRVGHLADVLDLDAAVDF